VGGEDLKPGILITETRFFNQGGEFDWNFAAERSPSVNNRSIAQAMGKAIGGGTSINGRRSRSPFPEARCRFQ
jgi:choline dehydrogenase